MWLTMEEIADYLKVSKETIYKMAQKKQIPGSKIGNQWRFHRGRIDAWMNEHSNEAAAPAISNQISESGKEVGRG